jgi:DNA-directed RNA polymerase subunit alpha
LSRLVIPKIECVESQDNFGRFLATPLEKGFGVTLGNSLRRVLLSYLPGAAVTRIRIEGVQHEFSTIPHVKEDVTEFILNVKEIRLIPLSSESGRLTLEVTGEGQLCAGDIKPSTDFEIANPELYLATLDSPEARLYVEFDVELGEGYRQAESRDDLPIGTIPVDAIFTPVRRVNFTVEPTHIGQETSREQLSLEVWTDGAMLPVDAVSRSAAILVEQLTPFVSCAQAVEAEVEEQRLRSSISEELYNMPVDKLDLSVRTMNCLRRGGIETVGQIITKGEKGLMALRNFGQKSRQEMEGRLKELGLSLAPPEGLDIPPEEGTVDET